MNVIQSLKYYCDCNTIVTEDRKNAFANATEFIAVLTVFVRLCMLNWCNIVNV